MSEHNYTFTVAMSRDTLDINNITTTSQSLDILFAKVLKGDPGTGIPVGGTTGQVLKKRSATDYDTEWSNSAISKADVEAVLTGEISTHTHPHDATKQDKIDAQHKLSYSLISDTPAIPTKTSDLTNDSGFLTSHQDISGKVDKVAGKGLSTNDYTNTDKQKVADAYVKPNGGIPSSDLSSTVQASLGKADTALQEHQDISGKQDKIDASHKLPYSYLSGTPTIPTKTSELTNDSGFLTSHQSLAEYRTSEDQDDIDDGIKDRLNDLEAKTALSDFTDDLGSSPTHTHQTYQDQINALKSIGRFLAIWNCSTGKPLTDPTELPYTYKTGDYYRVGAVSTGTNYKPNGATYTGVASTTVETDDVKTGWVYYYDGTQWKVQSGGATIPVVDVQAEGTSVLNSATGVANVTRSSLGLGNVNNTSDANKPISTATQTALNAKQDTISDLATIRSNAAAGKTASDNLAGHTVAKNVPADAQFTDTVYDDTALAGRVSTIEGKESGWDGKYSKPSGGIPKTDLASGVQESLGKADSALQSYTETDPVFVASAAHGISASDISNWNAKGTYSKPSDGIPSSDMASAVQTSLGKADSALQTKADVEGVLTGEISTHTHAHDTTKVNEPSSEGTSGQVLTTDGDGGRSWTTVQGGGGEPAAYIKDAVVANEMLMLTKKNDTTVTLDVSGKQNIIQVSAMPSQPHTGQIVQYIGATQGSLVNGAFYRCVYVDNSHIDSVMTEPSGLISNVRINGEVFRAFTERRDEFPEQVLIVFEDGMWSSPIGGDVYSSYSAWEFGISFDGTIEADNSVEIEYTSAPPAYSWQRISFVFSDDVSSALPSATQSLTSESKASVRNNLDTQQTLEWLTNAEIDAMFN